MRIVFPAAIALVLVTLLGGCSQSSVLAKGDYWAEFLGPGEPRQYLEASGAAKAPPPGAPGGQSLQTATDDSVAAMKEAYAKADSFIRSFPAAEDRYHTTTTRLRKAIADAGASPDDAQRAKLAGAFNQASTLLEAQNTRIEGAKSSFDEVTAPIIARAGELERSCSSPDAGASDRATVCPQFLNALSLFRVKLEVTATGFAQITEVYDAERRIEDELARQKGFK